jgi:serine/threonine-protein kinase
MEHSQQINAGQAMRTDPGSGRPVAPGTEVALFVSSGVPLQRVPDVVGLDRATANVELTNAGFAIASTTQTSTSVQPGSVISQSPVGGSTAGAGTTVTIVVAKAPPTATVPSVTGESAAAASGTLTSAGFQVTQTDTTVTNQSNNGIVLSQSPGGGSTRPKGANVTIIVGKFVPTNVTTTTTTTSKTTTSTAPSSATSQTTSTSGT